MKKTFTKLVAAAALLLFASGTFATTLPSVLIAAAANSAWVAEVQSKLQATGQFSSVQTYLTNTGTPTLSFLQQFNAVMVFTDNGCQDPTTFGNNLAQYIDGGGGVVSTTFDDASIPIGGNFNTNTYRVLLPASQTQGVMHSLGTVYLSSHPIMSGVTSFNGGTSSYMSTSTTLAPGAYRIADYDNGAPLITAKECVGPAGARRADLNFYPPSTDSRSDFWSTATDGAKIMANALTWVTIANAVPSITNPISGNVTVCPNATGTYSIPLVTGATSYSWTVTGGAVINSGNGTNSISVTFASANSTISVTANNCAGASIPQTLNVTVAPVTVSLGSNVTQCGGTVMLDAGNPGSTYAWSNAATTQTITVSSSGTYSVTVTNGSGCTGTGSVVVTINTPPTVALGPDVTQCGGTVMLDAGNAGSTYLWSDASTTQTITVSSTGTYSVTVTDANGCTGTGTVNVTINTPPTVALGADVTQCGGTVMLDAGNAGSTYLWSDASTTQMITVSSSGTYSVIVTDANGCTGTDAVDVTINTPPTVTLNMPNTTVCVNWPAYALSGGSPSGGTYSGTGVSAGNFDPSVAGQGTFVITYDYTDVNGCNGNATQSITVDVCAGISSNLDENSVSIYPNPSAGNFVLNVEADGLKDVMINVLDVQGKVVYAYSASTSGNSLNRTLSMEELSSGVYCLQVVTNLGVITKKLVIQE